MAFLTFISLMLIAASAFFVAAEYSLVSSRRPKIEALSRAGNKTASQFLRSLDQLSRMVAVCQIGITMVGIAAGIYIEPLVREVIEGGLGLAVDRKIAQTISFLFVSFVLVELGELVPKYATLRNPERTALRIYRPLKLIGSVLFPLTIGAEWFAKVTLGMFGLNHTELHSSSLSKEELLLVVQSGGVLESDTAEMVAKALRLDTLDALDVMIHRLDVKWINAQSNLDETLDYFGKFPYSRLPVCETDLDDVIGIVYVHDVVRAVRGTDFDLRKLARQAVAVPENLTLDRILTLMRDKKTQLVIVVDEYGGTSGIVTLEDLVEEIFGEFDDQHEAEQPMIKVIGKGRVSAKAEVRVDELMEELRAPIVGKYRTETLASLVTAGLERVPKIGDKVTVEFGVIRVDNMARRRITRVSVFIKPELQKKGN